MSAPGDVAGWRRALVVFGGHADLWWLRMLRPGFRHCFVVLECAGGWVMVDPLSHYTAIAHVPFCEEFDPKTWYGLHDMLVVEVHFVSPNRRVLPIRPYSCVECVKRILGIRAGFVLTPWQLYRYLNKSRIFMVDVSSSVGI